MPDDLAILQGPKILQLHCRLPRQVRALQRCLRALGYLKAGIDGKFSDATRRAVCALQYDLLANDGASSGGDGPASVAVRDYNQSRVAAVNGVADAGVKSCVADMMKDARFPKLPFSSDAAEANRRVLKLIAAMPSQTVPTPFLVAVVFQESGGKHYHEPKSADSDSFVVVGLDTNNSAHPEAVTSRGFGIGQYTLFHHPPRQQEVDDSISDPVANVSRAIRELRAKFDHFIVSSEPAAQSDDRIHEVGSAPLRMCTYNHGDPRYMTDCVRCMAAAGKQQIVAGQTPVYAGAAQTYAATQYHSGSYSSVPIRKNIPCDWPYAVRRYNGSGPDSYDYQAEVLVRISRLQPASAVAGGAPG